MNRGVGVLILLAALALRGGIVAAQDLNQGWKFLRVERRMPDKDLAPAQPEFDDSKWESVTLPHTAKVEPRMAGGAWQGVAWYRRHLKFDPGWKGRRVSVEFEAGMHLAKVWLNGRQIAIHEGGYLPIVIDLTGKLDEGDNLLAVMLDNRDNKEIPPGKPQAGLDFSYFGGLYRNARLVVRDPIHITDPMLENEPGSGGVFVRTEKIGPDSAGLLIKVQLRNGTAEDRQLQLLVKLTGPDGKQVGEIRSSLDLKLGAAGCSSHAFAVRNPLLWHPDHPHLYTMKVEVYDGERLADAQTLRFGIRRVEYRNPGGLFLNGEHVDIQGTNRHQEYPYLGNAASDNAQWRDAWKLKRAGFNLVRLSHYPQSPAFIDACDELGLMLIEPTPGWQFWNNSGHFKGNVESDVRRMIRRDRNHPSIVLWETVLNESGGVPDEFYGMINRAAHEEYPGDQMFTAGDAEGRKPAIANFDLWFAEWDQKRFIRGMFLIPDQAGYVREYGDYEFGGNWSTSRAFRGDGEAALLLQAWNFQWSLNRNNAQPTIFGSGNWVSIDHNRGGWKNQRVSAPGTFDQFRLPKFTAYFYTSQRDPGRTWPGLNAGTELGPVVFIANYWTSRQSPAKVVVYSNCEEVELLLNGRAIARQKPDSGPDTEYAGTIDSRPEDWNDGGWIKSLNKLLLSKIRGPLPADPAMVKPFDGGNCAHLAHPPFTFTRVPYEPGELKTVGYIGGRAAAEAVVRTPDRPARLELEVDLSGKPLAADSADFVFVYARVLDQRGTVVPGNDSYVRFSADGPARLVGDNPVAAEAGIATILLQSTGPAGKIRVMAEAPGLQPAVIEVEARDK